MIQKDTWYCIARTAIVDSVCNINISFESYAISLSIGVGYGDSFINILDVALSKDVIIGVKITFNGDFWELCMVSNIDIENLEINLLDNYNWEKTLQTSSQGTLFCYINDISGVYVGGGGAGGGGLPIAHTHPISDVEGLPEALDKKFDKSNLLNQASEISESDENVYTASRSKAEDEKRLRKDIEDTASKLITFKEGIVLPGGALKLIIKSTDENVVSGDESVYSSKKTLILIKEEIEEISKIFLRKDIDDTASGNIIFKKNIKVEEKATAFDLDVTNIAQLATAVVKILRSGRFVSGFLGEGMRLWEDLASGWNFEVDNLLVRKAMKVFELIIHKIRAVGGTLIVSAADGKIDTVTLLGSNYYISFEDDNMFLSGDYMRCQNYTTGKFYWVKISSVVDGKVVVNKSEFGQELPEPGDECVLLGSSIKKRQNAIIISASEGETVIDCYDGINNKSLVGCLKTRIGDLSGISDSRFPVQPSGYGLYGNNCFLSGSFIMRSGIDVETKFQIIEGVFSSEISAVKDEINQKGNCFKNSTFSDNLAWWLSGSDITYYTVSQKYLSINKHPYLHKESYAYIDSASGRKALHLHKSYISQSASNYQNLDKFTQESREFTLVFYYKVNESGVLNIKFNNSKSDLFPNISKTLSVTEGFVTYKVSGKWDGTGDFFLSFTGDIHISSLSFTDDPVAELKVELETKILQNQKLIALKASKTELNSLGEVLATHTGSFHVSATEIAAMVTATTNNATEINGVKQTIATAGWITSADGNILYAKREEFNALGNRVSSAESAIDQNAYQITLKASRDELNDLGELVSSHKASFHVSSTEIAAMVTATTNNATEINGVKQTIATAGWITSADGNILYAKREEFNALGNRVSSAESAIDQNAYQITLKASRDELNDLGELVSSHKASFHVSSTEIAAMVTATTNNATEINGVKQTIATAGWITSADGNILYAKKSDYNALANRVSSAESSITQTASQIALKVSETDFTGENLVSMINQTASTVKILAKNIKLEGLVTMNGNVEITLDGKIIANDGEFRGKVIATTGSIGGFEIGDGRIGSTATASGSGGALAIYSDFFRVGGSQGYVLFGNNVLPSTFGGAFSSAGRIVNQASNTSSGYGFDTANYGLFINVSGGTKNFGIDSNAALKAPAFINTKVRALTITGSYYTIDFSQHSIFLLSAPTSYSVSLPTESSISKQFGLSSLPGDFGFIFTLVIRGGSAPLTINGIVNNDNDAESMSMEPGDVLTVLCTKSPSFQYKALSRYS